MKNKKIVFFLLIVLTLSLSSNVAYSCLCWAPGCNDNKCCSDEGDKCCHEEYCTNGLECDKGRNECTRCGGLGEKCCSGSSCDSSTLTCEAGTCRQICPKQNSGCYLKNDVPSGVGTIKPLDYHYYLETNKCFRTGFPPTPNPLNPSTPSTPSNNPPSNPPTSPGCPTGQIMCNNRCWPPVCIDDTGCAPGQFCIRPGTCDAECFSPNCDPITGCAIADITGMQTASGCVCRDSREDVNKQEDPDNSADACGCIKGAQFDGACCGDDVLDCASKNSAGDLCVMNFNIRDGSRWVDVSSNRGDTVYVPCVGTLYLSNGTNWYKCDSDGKFKGPNTDKKIIKAGNHQYLCMGFGRKSIVECCGDGQCQAKDNDAIKLKTGEPINPVIYTNEPGPSFTIESYSLDIGAQCTATTRTCNVVNGVTCLFQHYSNCAGQCIQTCQNGCNNNQCVGQTPPTIASSQQPPPSQTPSNRNACGLPVGSCDAPPGEIKYENEVRSAISAYISSNAQIASKRNDDFDAVKDYLNGVVARLRGNGNGFQAERTKNCNDNEAADAIIVRRSGDQHAEYYGIIINVGSGRTIRDTANIGYVEKASWSRALSNYPDYGKNMLYYCRADGTFSINLDTPGTAISGNPATTEANRQICETHGGKWTGAKCCGEPGICDYHMDTGAEECFSNSKYPSVSFAPNTANSVILYGGAYHGCAIAKDIYNASNNVLLELYDDGTNNLLIQDHDYCFNDPERNHFCSYTEKWIQTLGKNRTKLSHSPVSNPKQAAECCGNSECWNGDMCIANQRNNPTAQPLNGKRCIDGEWQSAFLRYTPDESASGYCPAESQCLLNPMAQPESQCVETGGYSNDNYCQSGVWSTRTKLLALKLLSMKNGDYALFCDDRENSLNNLQYLTSSNEVVVDVLQNLGTNNFCVMKNNDKIIAAVSINMDIESAPSGSINIFGVTTCSNALTNDGEYHSCDSSNKVWYNKKLKSFIYSSSSINVPSSQTNFAIFIQNPIQFIANKIKALINPTPAPDTYYVDKLKKFDKLYLSEEKGRTIRGVVEGLNIKNLIVGYSGIDSDICAMVNQYNEEHKDASSGISCKKEGSSQYVIAQGSRTTNINPETLWIDLTSKMRIS